MDKMNYPRGLVRYTTENRLNGIPTHILRPRIFIYGTILLALLLGLLYMVSQRVPVLLDIIRDRNSLYRELNDGSIENIYTLKIMNMDKEAHSYKLTAAGIDAMKLEMDVENIHVDSGDVLSLPVRLVVDPAHLSQMSSIVTFELNTLDQPTWTTTEEGRFLGPLPTTR
jgi:polyferredoxin